MVDDMQTPDGIPRVTMVVAMRNEIATIGRCLASLAAQDHPSDRLEVLVYDGGSTDGSMELATELVKDHPGWAVRPNPRQIQAAAWNLGIDAATGTYTGIVSGHAELDAGYVTASLAAIEETGATMVGGPVRAIGEGAIGKAVAAALSSPFGVGGARHHYLTERDEVDTVFMGSTSSPVLRGAKCPILTAPIPASIIESQTFMTSSRASALDSDLYSTVPSRASQTNRIGGLASW